MLFDEEITIIVQTDSTAPVQSVNGKIGFVSIDKSDVGLSNVENVSILGASGYLQSQINNISGGGVTGDYYPNSNPSGFITGVDLSSLYPRSNPSGFITGVDLSALYPRSNPSGFITGVDLSALYPRSNPSGFITGVDLSALYPRSNPSGFVTGVDLSALYPRSNPSGYITGVNLSSYATISNLEATGSTLSTNLATTGSTLATQINNLSGTLTGNYATISNLVLTGLNLDSKINNLSGVSVLTYGNQTIDGVKTFRNSIYIHDLYVTGTEFIANVQNNFIESSYILLNLTGGAVDGGIFFVTGSGLTGVNDYGPIIGFDHTDKFKFGIARRSDDLSTLNDIAAVQDITNYSGFINNKYATITNLNLTGNNLETQINTISTKVIYTTGNQIKSGRLVIGDTILDTSNPYTLSLQSNNQDTFLEILNSGGAGKGVFYGINNNNLEQYNWQGGDIVFFTAENPSVGIERLYIKNDGKVGIGTSFPSEKLEVNGNIKASGASFINRPTVNGSGLLLNGEAYPSNNPSGFITGIDLSSYITTSQTGNFYTNNNPSGYITGVDLSNYYTKDNPSGFITGINLSNYATTGQLSQASENLQNQINSLNNSGFITGIESLVYTTGDQTISGLKTFVERPQVNGTGVLLSGEAAGSANFQYLPVTGNTNLLSNNRYSFNTFNKNITGTLPLDPEKGDEIELYDSAGAWSINPLIINNNGNYIEQIKDMLQCNVNNGLIKLIYTTENNIGWRIIPMPIHNVASILPPSISITGGPTNGLTPLSINLTGVNLIGAQAPVDEWYWNLNTGDQNFINGQTINYTYNETGLYNITLSGSNSVGFDIENITISVTQAFLPVNGLLVRFNSDVGVNEVGGAITSWTDQQNGVVATAFNSPTLLTNAFNGRKAVYFDGTNEYFNGTFGTALASNSNRTFVIIGKYNAMVGQRGIFDGSSDLEAYIFHAGSSLYYNNGPQIGPVYGDFISNYFIQIINTSDGGNTVFRVNGVENVNGAMNRPLMNGFTIGRRGNGNEHANFNMVELLVYNRSLTLAEMQEIETYANV
jgi:hypothetical protein